MKHYKVELLNDKTIEVAEGQTILEASLAAGVPHYHACGGYGECSTCRIFIKEGAEFLSPVSEKEEALRARIPFPAEVRLACQTYVKGGNVRAHRMIRDETDVGLYMGESSPSDLDLMGQEKELALFFLDIRNFTPFIQAYLPFDVIHIGHRLFTIFKRVIETNRGSIIETAGDGFYAVFGLEDPIETAANNACKAGFALQEEIDHFNKAYMTINFRHSFTIGMGLHVGKVIVGNIGIGVNNNLTAMGLPVNIAARLQNATKELNNNFIISDEAFRLLTTKPTDSSLSVQLKGLKDSVLVHLIGQPYH